MTLTVTEKGYCHNPATGDLDLTHPDIRADLAGRDPPRSTLGWLVRGLKERRAASAGGLTVLCCDNMASNGRTLRGLVRQFAAELAPGLAAWIEDEVRFPSSMVDRIVPAATPASLDHAAALLGLRDEAAVSTEGFAQWVIEDDFAGPAALGAAGAELVGDVRPYQELKLRLLNGAHSAIAYLGALLGKPFVADVMADPELAGFIERLMFEEIARSPCCPQASTSTLRPARCAGSPTARCGTAPCRSPWTARRRSRALAADAARGPAPGPAVPTPRHRARGLAASSAAATRPAGSCRSTTRWRRVCARRGVLRPRSRRPWSEPRSRSMRCSAATCGKMRSWSTSSRPCSRGSHMPACAPPLPTDRAAREVGMPDLASHRARPSRCGRPGAGRAATIIDHQWRHR